MSSDLTTQDVLTSLGPSQSKTEEVNPGTTTSSITGDIKNAITIMGAAPEDSGNKSSTVEFDCKALMETFCKYCWDFNDEIKEGVKSCALQFAAKIIFEMGTNLKNAKSNSNKGIRFRFRYKKDEKLIIKVVIVTFRNTGTTELESDDTMSMTFKQAMLLSMVTFEKLIKYAYNQTRTIMMTPLCRVVFSRESVPVMAKALSMEDVDVILMINQSTCGVGQFLPNSDMACAIVQMLVLTKHVRNPAERNRMIPKLIKEYAAMHKVYYSERYIVFAQHVLGDIPLNLDPETLIQKFSSMQIRST